MAPMGKSTLTIMAAYAQLQRDTVIVPIRVSPPLRPTDARWSSSQDRRRRGTKVSQLEEQRIAAIDIVKMFGVAPATVYRYSFWVAWLST